MDCPFQIHEAEYQGKDVELNKPKRGGDKKFYVYVKDPKSGNIRKVSFGDTTGLSVKFKDLQEEKHLLIVIIVLPKKIKLKQDIGLVIFLVMQSNLEWVIIKIPIGK